MPPSPPPWTDCLPRLVLYARRLGASPEVAEDLVHAAAEMFLRNPGAYDPSRASVHTWLRRVVRNRWFDEGRKRSVRTRTAPKLALVPPPEDPAQAVARRRAAERRAAFLDALGPEHRPLFEAWVRQRRGDLDASAAAASVGLDVAAYEAAKKRLRRRCLKLLEELGLRAADLLPDRGSAA